MQYGLLANIGKADLVAVAAQVSARYRERTGHTANTAMVHPAMLPDGDFEENGLRFRSNPWVALGHVWVGVEETV